MLPHAPVVGGTFVRMPCGGSTSLAAVDITGSDFLIAGGAAASFFYGPDAQKS